MFPTIKNGDVLFVSRINFPAKIPFWTTPIQIGSLSLNKNEIVIFENEKNETLVKRLAGLPFDFYKIQNGKVSTSPNEFPDEKNSNSETGISVSITHDSEFLPLLENGRIPENYYLLIGDNREYSTDSRSFGLVPQSYLRGKVLWRF